MSWLEILCLAADVVTVLGIAYACDTGITVQDIIDNPHLYR
jgi:hypothetical protein